ncbi:hypothetical protein Scep_021963 [Stephania cephalantha]|uniref:Uncharacterized protein n=1 Tax=Stephania cephalantha TaxID=152367 RepID=A0AAP0I296_9MAGN
MATTATPTPVVDFRGVLSESNKILKAHSRHFLALSVLFLLPISFLLVSFHTLHLSFIAAANLDGYSIPTQTLLRSPPQLHLHLHLQLQPLLLPLLFALLLLSLSLCAAATITYSVYHGFFGRPVKLLSAIKSLTTTLPRLLLTFLCAKLLLFAFALVVAAIAFLLLKLVDFTGLRLPYSVVWAAGVAALGFMLVVALVNWGLACSVVVAESSWGLEPLRRSGYLVKGLRRLAFWLVLYFGSALVFILLASRGFSLSSGVVGALMSVLSTVVPSAALMLLLLHSLAATTVLYMYCKAMHGELAMEIAEEFAREYLSLPFDDEKTPLVVSVIQH